MRKTWVARMPQHRTKKADWQAHDRGVRTRDALDEGLSSFLYAVCSRYTLPFPRVEIPLDFQLGEGGKGYGGRRRFDPSATRAPDERQGGYHAVGRSGKPDEHPPGVPAVGGLEQDPPIVGNNRVGAEHKAVSVRGLIRYRTGLALCELASELLRRPMVRGIVIGKGMHRLKR